LSSTSSTRNQIRLGASFERRSSETPRRIWFRVDEVELKWLRMSETAFLLWVLAALVLAWLVVALVIVLV
jgi:hypothetical protein